MNEASDVPGPVVQAGVVLGGIHLHHERAETALRQLPPTPAHFTGRAAELATLTTALAGQPGHDGPPLALVTGPGGVGKTALAVYWLHTERIRFPDGQLYADLSAHGPQGPTSPREVLGGFLRGMGVSVDDLPTSATDRSALYRSLTAEKAISILLDDAVSSTQVRALLPASGRSAVVVTSRKRLPGLVALGGRMVPVESLPPDAAVELLSRTLGWDRVASEPGSARRVALLCGGMPIALHIAAARLVVRPHWQLAAVAAELTDERHRLRVLVAEDGDLSVAATFDLSYRGLPQPAARMYRLLGLHPGADFDRAAAAALSGGSDAEAEDLLGVLVELSLLADIAPDRYRFHDLLRLHAARQTERDDSVEDRRKALRSVVLSYLNRAVAADLVVTPLRPHLGERYGAPNDAPFDTRASALDWLEREVPNLLACQHRAFAKGWYDLAWQFYEALWGLFLYRGYYERWAAAGELAVEAAVRSGDAMAEVRMLIQSAALNTRLGRPAAAVAPYRRALQRAHEVSDWQGEATALEGLGAVEHALGHFLETMVYYRRALALNENHGLQRGVALLLCYIGHALVDMGDHDAAADHFRGSADSATAIGDRHCWAQAIVGLGTALAAGGAIASAIVAMERGLTELPADEAATLRLPVLEKLAELRQRLGNRIAARRHLQEALEICMKCADPRAHALRKRLDLSLERPPCEQE